MLMHLPYGHGRDRAAYFDGGGGLTRSLKGDVGAGLTASRKNFAFSGDKLTMHL